MTTPTTYADAIEAIKAALFCIVPPGKRVTRKNAHVLIQRCVQNLESVATLQPAAVGDGGLKPCPFCGDTDVFVERGTFSSCYVQCNGCGMRGPEKDQDSDDEETPGEVPARSAWNTRATPAPSAPAQAMVDIIERIRVIARDHGWAIGIHGSLRRDIDLIAAPWTKEAAQADVLKAAICSALGYRELDRTTTRPHGRRTALLVEQNATHEQELMNRGQFVGPVDPKGQWIPPAIDLSFMDPRAVPAQAMTQAMVEAALSAFYGRCMDHESPGNCMRAALTAALTTQPTEASK